MPRLQGVSNLPIFHLVPSVRNVHKISHISHVRFQPFVAGMLAALRSSRRATRAFAQSRLLASSSQPTKSWQAKTDEEVQRVTTTAMIHELTTAHTNAIASTVPWFLKTMPASYFRQTSYETRLEHLKAIAAMKNAQMELSLNITSSLPDGSDVVTFIRKENSKGLLNELLEELPNYQGKKTLSRVGMYKAADNSMVLAALTSCKRLANCNKAGILGLAGS